MSHGPGKIEKRIAELFAATRDRTLSVADLADHAFALAGRPATRAQRLSATRAGHRLLRRMKDAAERRSQLIDEVQREAEAAVGSRPEPPLADLPAYDAYRADSAAYDAVFTRQLSKPPPPISRGWSNATTLAAGFWPLTR